MMSLKERRDNETLNDFQCLDLFVDFLRVTSLIFIFTKFLLFLSPKILEGFSITRPSLSNFLSILNLTRMMISLSFPATSSWTPCSQYHSHSISSENRVQNSEKQLNWLGHLLRWERPKISQIKMNKSRFTAAAVAAGAGAAYCSPSMSGAGWL